MRNERSADDGRPLATNRSMEMLVAILLLAVCVVVMFDSTGLSLRWFETGTNRWIPEIGIDRARFTWQEGFGPGPGYFPFWVAVVLGTASLINLASAVLGRGAGEVFVSARPFGRVLAVLIPSACFLALIGGISLGPLVLPGLGIYVASCIFIAAFMIAVGRENPLRALGIGLAVPIMLFFMFEKWFLVPLPKGPLEAMLGLG
jgi:hypothetical protein